MIDLRIQPSAPWFGLDFFTKKLEKEFLAKQASLDGYLHIYNELQASFTALFEITDKQEVLFFSHDELAQFLQLNKLSMRNSLGVNYNKEQFDQRIDACLDISFQIPFDFRLQLEEGLPICFDPSKGLGLLPGMVAIIAQDKTTKKIVPEKFDRGNYILLRQFQYILEQISLRGLAQLKYEFLTKAALIDHMVVNHRHLQGYLIKDKYLRSPYVQVIMVEEPQRLYEYLKSHGINIEIENHTWILPNFIVHSKETYFFLSEVVDKYE
jgi:hypothetical protein